MFFLPEREQEVICWKSSGSCFLSTQEEEKLKAPKKKCSYLQNLLKYSNLSPLANRWKLPAVILDISRINNGNYNTNKRKHTSTFKYIKARLFFCFFKRATHSLSINHTASRSEPDLQRSLATRAEINARMLIFHFTCVLQGDSLRVTARVTSSSSGGILIILN